MSTLLSVAFFLPFSLDSVQADQSWLPNLSSRLGFPLNFWIRPFSKCCTNGNGVSLSCSVSCLDARVRGPSPSAVLVATSTVRDCHRSSILAYTLPRLQLLGKTSCRLRSIRILLLLFKRRQLDTKRVVKNSIRAPAICPTRWSVRTLSGTFESLSSRNAIVLLFYFRLYYCSSLRDRLFFVLSLRHCSASIANSYCLLSSTRLNDDDVELQVTR